MVLAAKVFTIEGECDFHTIALKMKDYKIEEEFIHEEHRIKLLTEIKDLFMTSNTIQAVFSQDQILNIHYRGDIIPTPKTTEAPILFTQYNDRLFLIVLENKQKANNIANILSKILLITIGNIIEARIEADTLQKFHEQNYEDTKVIFFDDINIPNITKLSLYGSALANTNLYIDYLTRGDIWYVIIKSKDYGYVIGLTRNAVVTVFNKIEKSHFATYIVNEILPLIS